MICYKIHAISNGYQSRDKWWQMTWPCPKNEAKIIQYSESNTLFSHMNDGLHHEFGLWDLVYERRQYYSQSTEWSFLLKRTHRMRYFAYMRYWVNGLNSKQRLINTSIQVKNKESLWDFQILIQWNVLKCCNIDK